jgi:hypothetical protein
MLSSLPMEYGGFMDSTTEGKKTSPINLSASDIIANSLASLSDESPAAYKICMAMNQEMFFELPQSKGALNKLADKILSAVLEER